MSVINTNLSSLKAQTHLGRAQTQLATAMERLSSGLRINSARDDAAGHGIANRMEVNLRANDAVSRGINDGISLMQTAEGGLNGINGMLHRSRQLAVQAATGTLSDTDRAAINAEYMQIRAEIDRTAMTTEIFGKYPLAPAEVAGEPPSLGETNTLAQVFGESGTTLFNQSSGVRPMAFIPAGATNVTIVVDGIAGAEDDIQIFNRDGKHLVGTPLDDYTWTTNGIEDPSDLETQVFQDSSLGFSSSASYDDSDLLHYEPAPGEEFAHEPGEGINGTYGGMTFVYSGDGDRFDSDTYPGDGSTDAYHGIERLHIDEVTEPLMLVVTGGGIFHVTAEWDAMPGTKSPGQPSSSEAVEIVTSANYGQKISKVTIEPTPADHASLGLTDVALDPLEKAQEAISKLQEALNTLDGYRGQYGALNNRFESAIENLATQSINTAAARSKILDADYATEVSRMTRAQILMQAGSSMLSQANQTPQTALSLLGG